MVYNYSPRSHIYTCIYFFAAHSRASMVMSFASLHTHNIHITIFTVLHSHWPIGRILQLFLYFIPALPLVRRDIINVFAANAYHYLLCTHWTDSIYCENKLVNIEWCRVCQVSASCISKMQFHSYIPTNHGALEKFTIPIWGVNVARCMCLCVYANVMVPNFTEMEKIYLRL